MKNPELLAFAARDFCVKNKLLQMIATAYFVISEQRKPSPPRIRSAPPPKWEAGVTDAAIIYSSQSDLLARLKSRILTVIEIM